ncbi:putative Ig domain-containing protein, partial [Caldimonas tepidiphila]|uniref:putative Ig domain-containing protein n=1 Tax=Caldimonas tepidiphila TaxID=2315841 RepID=UPI00196AF98D
TTDPSAPKDDDRALTVSSPAVNEASPYAVFRTTGAPGQLVRLSLLPGTADGADYGGSGSANPQLQVFNGSSWVPYVAGSRVAVGSDGQLLVRTSITNDDIDEGAHHFQLRAENGAGGAFIGTATIDDHGAGDVFLANNTSGNPDRSGASGYPRLDDDRPRPVLLPAAPVQPSAPPAPPVLQEVAPAPSMPAQHFDSMLDMSWNPLSGALRDFAPVFEQGSDSRTSFIVPGGLEDIYTRASGFRAMVSPSAEPSLKVFRGVEDQIVPVTSELRLQVPADAFVHTDANETVQLVATLADGTPLPPWLRFDGKSGTFTGEPPQGEEIDLRLKVVARDSQGRDATVMFRIKSGEAGKGMRPGLNAQLMRGEALMRSAEGRDWQPARHALPSRA